MLKFIEGLNSNVGSSVNVSQKIFSSTYGITSTAAFGDKTMEQQTVVQVMLQVT